MKTGVLIGLVLAAFSTSGAWAESNQQTQMKTCNADAKKQSLTGDARKTFMKTCLSSTKAASTEAMPTPAGTKPAADGATPTVAPSKTPEVMLNKSGKPMTAQQLRMKNCNAEAKSQELKGDPRKVFMKSCLSSKK